MIELVAEIEKPTIIIGDFNNYLSIMISQADEKSQ